jgi:hypothetical protein
MKKGVAPMASADTFEGAKNGLTFLFAYMNMVGQDIGMERATALDTKMCEAMGAAHGKAIRAQAGIEELDAAVAASLTGRSIEQTLGISSEVVQEGAQETVVKVGRCPVYEAAQALGMEGAAIEASCRAGSIRYMDTVVKQFDPRLSYQLREFRSSAEDSCVEAIILH